MSSEERDGLLIKFYQRVASEEQQAKVKRILKGDGVSTPVATAGFQNRNFRRKIQAHCKTLYLDGHYFHAVLEACKVYNKTVRAKAREKKMDTR